MKSILLMAAAGVLMAAPCSHAQQSPRSPDPADPAVAVPPPVYQSAMSGYSRLPKEKDASPDKTWRQLNDALAAGPAHAPHGPAPAPAEPAQSAKPAPAHDAHQHH